MKSGLGILHGLSRGEYDIVAFGCISNFFIMGMLFYFSTPTPFESIYPFYCSSDVGFQYDNSFDSEADGEKTEKVKT